MVVVGCVRAGGGGKTPVAAQLAKQYAAQGLRVGILAHAVHARVVEPARRVNPDTSWKQSSDEAVWLAQTTGLPVWVTRDRWRAWHTIAQSHTLDLLVSDDGLEDPRLVTCRRILLDWGDPSRHWWNLLPVGRCRSLLQDHPGAEIWPCARRGVPGRVGFHISGVRNIRGESLVGSAVVLCGIGDPERFLEDLRAFGVSLLHVQALSDHSAEISSELRRLLGEGVPAIIVTSKDWIRLDVVLRTDSRIFLAEQAVRLG